jgi:hypothetical protein
MKLKEDLTLSVRAMFGSPLESLLLIIGLALSIGATASGFGMYGKAVQDGKALLQMAEYREIVVTPQASQDEMTQPLAATSEEDAINLDMDDLDAKNVSPDIAYSYLMGSKRLMINTAAFLEMVSSMQRPNDEGGDQPAQNTDQPAQDTDNQSQPAEEADKPAAENAQEDDRPEQAEIELATVEGPEPTVDELMGYEVTAEFFPAMNMYAAEGSLFAEQDIANASKVLVLGSNIAKTLYEDGIVINRQIASFDKIYTIIGVLEETGTKHDDYYFTPSELASNSAGAMAQRGHGGNSDEALHFAVLNASALAGAEDQLTSWFGSLYGEGMTNISVPRETAEALIARNEKIAVITMVLALAGLLIASVNVSNILYSRTLRRRKQIGILKALGATRQEIFNLFLSEGAILLMIGALFGIGIVILFALAISSTSGSSSVNYLAVALGVVTSSIITLAFTVVPASQAAKVPPAEAMRVE